MKSRILKVFLSACLLISFCGCTLTSKKSQYIPENEKERFREFFKTFLFWESGVYTLYGSKPMTEIILHPETPEQKMALQQAALEKLSPEELADLKSSSFEYEEKYWYEETWRMWEELLKLMPIKRYLFVERKIGIPLEWQNNRYIYFINIAETAKVLQKNYPLFKEYVGFDFDPLSVVFEAKNPDSPFWNAIWGGEVTDKNVCLLGILFGFGFENSYPFSWNFTKAKSDEEEKFIKSFLQLATPTERFTDSTKFNPPDSFFLPGYISFSECDPYKEQYKREQERIRQIYINSDMIECSIQQLLR